jgi:hypothetical protein
MEYRQIKSFRGIDVGTESTDADEKSLSYAENIILRPRGAISRLPPLKKVWGFDQIQNYKTALGIVDADKACLLKITQPKGSNNIEISFLIVHDFLNNLPLGIFCASNSADSQSEISLDNLSQFISTNPLATIQILKKGLSEKARWFFYSFFDSVVLGNGIDENLIYQASRTTQQLRPIGTSVVPDLPFIESLGNVVQNAQASLNITFVTSVFYPPPRILADVKWDTTTLSHYMILKWTPTDTAEAYEIDFTDDPEYTTRTTIQLEAETAWQFDELDINTRYYFRIRALYKSGNATYYSPYTTGSHATTRYGFAGTNQGNPTQIAIQGIKPSEATARFEAIGAFKNSLGNNIRVELVAEGQSISSVRSGEGISQTDPIDYKVLGIGAKTIGELVTYIQNDPAVAGIFNCYILSGSATTGSQLTSKPPTFFSGGLGDPTAATVTPLQAGDFIGLTYFDPGSNNQGMESGISIALAINSTGKKLIKPIYKSEVDLQRFSKFRVYYKAVDQAKVLSLNLPANKWILLGECNNAPNTSFSAFLTPATASTIIKNDDTLIVDKLPPCSVFEMCQNRMFASGNANNTKRIWYSHYNAPDLLLPEAFNTAKQFIDMPSTKEDGAVARVTHLQVFDRTLQIHTNRGIVMMDGATLNRVNSRSDYGSINPSASTNWKHHVSPYLGSDGVLYEIHNQQVLKSNIANENSWEFVKNYIDTSEVMRNPNKANVYGDFTNQMVWVWMPCIILGVKKLAGFLYDYNTKGFSGPITYPGLVSVTKLNNTDPRIIGQTETGQIVYIDAGELNKDEFPANFSYSGTPYSDTANNIEFITNLLDFNAPNRNKSFCEVIINTSKGSYAQNVIIEMETDEGKKTSLNFGVMNKERNKVAFLLSGYSARLTIKAAIPANRPFVIRDIAIGYKIMNER